MPDRRKKSGQSATSSAETLRAVDWIEYLYLHRNDNPRPLKSAVAEVLGITPQQFSYRLDPSRYNPIVSDREAEITARMWNQTVDFVRTVFPRRQAA